MKPVWSPPRRVPGDIALKTQSRPRCAMLLTPDARKRYNETAGRYDSRYSEIQRTKYPLLLEGLSLLSGRKVLDWGCGTGLAFPDLKRIGVDYFGVDFSIGMLSIFREKQRAPVVLGECARLPFRSGVFDGVLGATVIQNMPDKTKALMEISRVLRKGGRAVISYPERTEAKIRSMKRANLKMLSRRKCGEDIALYVEKGSR